MFHVAGYFDVPAAHRTAFIDAALEDAHASLSSETGTRRFEVIQDVDNANRFYLDEVYDDAATFEAHVRDRTSRNSSTSSKSWRSNGAP